MLPKSGFCGARALLALMVGLGALHMPAARAAQAQLGCQNDLTASAEPGAATPGARGQDGESVAPRPTAACQGGTISASPSICNIDAATGVCASTIAWSTTAANLVRVNVFFYESGVTQVFSTAKSGSSVAPWINAAGMRFDLKADGGVVAAVDVVGNPPPSVSLTAPSAGAVVLSGQTTTLTASASDANGVSKVEFFDNGVPISPVDTLAPYSVNWSSTALGSHSLTARATDTRGAVRTSLPVVVTVAKVTLSASNKTVTSSVASGNTASAAFRLATAGKLRFQTSVGGAWVEQSPFAEWLEPESGVTAAQFEVMATWAGGVLPSSGAMGLWLNLGSATRDWVLTRAVAGTSQAVITIKIRRVGTTAVLASTNVALNATVVPPPNIPPSASLTDPTEGRVFHVVQGGTATIALAATASDPDGTVSKVEFFRQGSTIPVDTDTTGPSPFTGSWNNVAVGTYSLTAKATDNGNATGTSASRTVIVNALPNVSLPTPPAQTAPAGGTCTFTLSATASDSDGTIAKVEFLKSGALLPGTTGNPNPDTTAPYAFTWSGVAPGSYSLTARATDNSSGGNGQTESQPVTATCGGPPTATLTTPAANSSYTRPDGPILTATASTSAGTISRVEFFDNGAKLGEDFTAPYTYPPNGTTWDTSTVAAGSHSLTARAINSLGTIGPLSSPAVPITLLNPNPTVDFTAPAANSSHAELSVVTLTANASITLGSISKVEFFDGTTPIGLPVTAAPYSVPWTALGIGGHTLKAKATSSWNTTKITAIPVDVFNPPPTITLTAPSGGATFNAPAEITLSADASDVNGTVSSVEFFRDDGTTLIGPGVKNGNTFTFTWSNVPVGSYTLTAKATDNLNATTTTPAIAVSVTEPVMCFVLPPKPGSVP